MITETFIKTIITVISSTLLGYLFSLVKNYRKTDKVQSTAIRNLLKSNLVNQ